MQATSETEYAPRSLRARCRSAMAARAKEMHSHAWLEAAQAQVQRAEQATNERLGADSSRFREAFRYWRSLCEQAANAIDIAAERDSPDLVRQAGRDATVSDDIEYLNARRLARHVLIILANLRLI